MRFNVWLTATTKLPFKEPGLGRESRIDFALRFALNVSGSVPLTTNRKILLPFGIFTTSKAGLCFNSEKNASAVLTASRYPASKPSK